MNNSHSNKSTFRLLFYAAWLLVSLIQASTSELLADEAYYWKYAQDLSWGYFDHPPVVAALIKAGYTLLQNELGVRLLFILGSLLFLYIIELLVQPKRQGLFYLSVASIGAFHFLGFLALPDLPLLLFTATFLYLYKIYLAKDGWGVSLLLALNATLLLLSKYHGILVIGFVVLSNPAILTRKTFWLIALLSLNLFIPHIQWQVAHGMPSINYHLSERNTGGYQIDYTLNYLVSVLLMFGPLAGIVLVWHSIKSKPKDVFGRTLKWIPIGTLVFFFFMTFKGRGEANWVAFALIPAFISGYKICESKDWFPKFTRNAFIITIIIIMPLRTYLVVDYLPDAKAFFYLKETLHHTKKWATELKQKAGDRPVAFMNKYQYAAWYEFYTGHPSISLNNRMGRKNQYNIWNDEYLLQGKDIMLVPNYKVWNLDSFQTAKGPFQYQYIDNFRSASAVIITPLQTDMGIDRDAEEEVSVKFSLSQPKWNLQANSNYLPVIHALIFQDGKFVSDNSTEFYVDNTMLTDSLSYKVKIKAPAVPGAYDLYLDITMGSLPPAINSRKISMLVR